MAQTILSLLIKMSAIFFFFPKDISPLPSPPLSLRQTKLEKPLRNTEVFPLVHRRGEAIYFLPSCNITLHDGDATDYFVAELKEILLRKKLRD